MDVFVCFGGFAERFVRILWTTPLGFDLPCLVCLSPPYLARMVVYIEIV